jgi:hypothetical protein
MKDIIINMIKILLVIEPTYSREHLIIGVNECHRTLFQMRSF